MLCRTLCLRPNHSSSSAAAAILPTGSFRERLGSHAATVHVNGTSWSIPGSGACSATVPLIQGVGSSSTAHHADSSHLYAHTDRHTNHGLEATVPSSSRHATSLPPTVLAVRLLRRAVLAMLQVRTEVIGDVNDAMCIDESAGASFRPAAS